MQIPPSIDQSGSADGRRTIIALVSAAFISIAVFALLAIFDVR